MELEEKLKLLSSMRKDLMSQKETVKELKSKPVRITRTDSSIEELKMLLDLSKEELEAAQKELSKERHRSASNPDSIF